MEPGRFFFFFSPFPPSKSMFYPRKLSLQPFFTAEFIVVALFKNILILTRIPEDESLFW